MAHKQVSLLRTQDATLARLLDGADVVSEGSMRAELDGFVWYGSTSMIVALSRHSEPGDADANLAGVLATDLHTRTRAVRIAAREARLRSPEPLGPVRCEVRVRSVDGGLRIDVEVQAPLIEGRRRGGRDLPSV